MDEKENRYIDNLPKGKYYVLSFAKIAMQLGIAEHFYSFTDSKSHEEYMEEKAFELREKLKEYYQRRKKAIDAIEVPNHYMIAYPYSPLMINISFLEDADKMIALLGRVSDSLFVPSREIDFDTCPIWKSIAFYEEEFND